MGFIDLKLTPIQIKDVVSTTPVFEQPFLPAADEKYLTRIEVKMRKGDRFVLTEAEWIHPEGISMGKVSIATETHMVAKSRIASINAAVDKDKKRVAGFVVSLSDGGAYVLTEGIAER